jgi:hypothetical protein
MKHPALSVGSACSRMFLLHAACKAQCQASMEMICAHAWQRMQRHVTTHPACMQGPADKPVMAARIYMSARLESPRRNAL